jgi:hypothetical protein
MFPEYLSRAICMFGTGAKFCIARGCCSEGWGARQERQSSLPFLHEVLSVDLFQSEVDSLTSFSYQILTAPNPLSRDKKQTISPGCGRQLYERRELRGSTLTENLQVGIKASFPNFLACIFPQRDGIILA